MSKPVALTIAGSDPTGGAGVQADLKTFAAHKVYGASVVSVLTAQNASRFEVFPVPGAFISAQIEAVFEALAIKTIKIGMLGTVEAVGTIIDCLQRYNHDQKIPVVLDPVLKASNGGTGLEGDGLALLRDELLPLCTLIKPNLYEAAVLLDEKEALDPVQMGEQAHRLAQRYQGSVLLSGGHLSGPEAVDILFHEGAIHSFPPKKREHCELHGTGCALTSAIAANLANGHDLYASVERARSWLLQLWGVNMKLYQQDKVRHLDHLALSSFLKDQS